MLFSLLPLVGLAVACADHEPRACDSSAHAHVHEKHEYPQVPLTPSYRPTEYPQVTLTPPYRPLVWGDFNVIHTTDTHGWLLGHQKSVWPEPNYSGDLGDFSSFVTHMKQMAIQKDVDLLLVDSGDLHDGTGLSDGFGSSGVDGHESDTFLLRLPYDLMTIGNHELYNYSVTSDMYYNFVPYMNGRYLSSNVNITILKDGELQNVSVGSRFTNFTTNKGRKVTSFGPLFNFTSNAPNTTVQSVADMLKEEWFAEAMTIETDVFVLVGHMPVFNDSWPDVTSAIRLKHPTTPILIFGGHTHIRDCQQYDGRTMALESGKFMDTIGWMSADLSAAQGNTDNITFTRRYMDQNRVTYQYHTSTSNSTFDTDDGLDITAGLRQLSTNFHLSDFYGNATETYTFNQDPYPSAGNVFSFFLEEAAPFVLAINNTRANFSNIIIVNNGVLRYSIFEGPFMRNDQLTASPYPDSFSYIPNITAGVAKQVLPGLIKLPSAPQELWGRGHVEERYHSWLKDMSSVHEMHAGSTSDYTPGYVTTDGCSNAGGKGDDTLHDPITFYDLPPHYISSTPPNVTDDTPIDLVFLDFFKKKVVNVLNTIPNSGYHSLADVKPYSPTLTNEVLGLYAKAKWN